MRTPSAGFLTNAFFEPNFAQPSRLVGVMKGFEGDITEADDAFLSIVGYTRDDFERGRMNWRAMTPPEFLHLDEAGIQQAMTSGGFTAPYQKEFIRKDGTRVPVLLVCAFIPETPGQWMGYVVNLSPPRPARVAPETAALPLVAPVPQEFYGRLINELVRERGRMVAMLDHTDALVWAVDPAYRLLSANHAFQDAQRIVSGRYIEIGESLLDEKDFDNALVQSWRAWYDRALRGEQHTVHVAGEHYGEEIHRECDISPIHDAEGTIVGVTCISVDVTERTAAQRLLQASEARFRTLTYASPLGVFLADTSGMCVYANPRLATIWGTTAADLLGDGYVRRVHPDDRPRVTGSWAHAVAEGIELDTDFRLLHEDGDERFVRVRIAPVYEGGVLTGFVGTADDETERRSLARRVRQSEKMESLGTLAGGIAHDFNNMLGVVLGYTELALLDVDDPALVRENLDEIRTASLRARDLVRQILTFSRRSERERAPVDLKALISESVRLLRATFPAHLAVDVRLPQEAVSVLGDGSSLQQIVLNLCTNAEYAMRGRKDARLTVVLAVEMEQEKPHALLRISDTGRGMDAFTRDRIFEPFYTTKPLGEGTGMGLAVVHGIVRAHGGSISVTSVPERGSTFCIALPVADAGAVAEVPPDRMPRGVGTVLLVEDEPSLARFAELALQRSGYRVVCCEDGSEALRVFERDPAGFDLVLSDVSMPKLTGDRLAEEIRRVRTDIPVLLMTGFSHTVSPEHARTLGVGAVLQKPIGATDLVLAVGQALDAVRSGRTSSAMSSPR